ncbi:hypothetical protein F4677DRAFT_175072 [Hypoxylon crocopeplum]|nr:hypothetical protein F4677DRAFT_175072 [Hypoxylon crocopeplum]
MICRCMSVSIKPRATDDRREELRIGPGSAVKMIEIVANKLWQVLQQIASLASPLGGSSPVVTPRRRIESPTYFFSHAQKASAEATTATITMVIDRQDPVGLFPPLMTGKVAPSPTDRCCHYLVWPKVCGTGMSVLDEGGASCSSFSGFETRRDIRQCGSRFSLADNPRSQLCDGLMLLVNSLSPHLQHRPAKRSHVLARLQEG